MGDEPLRALYALLSCNLHGYARDGKALDSLTAWGELHDDVAYVHVRATAIGDDVEVSTVWVGLPQAGSTPECPLIFETMVFGGELDEYAWRYATEAEAERGHDVVVELARDRATARNE
jgi:hypothetical protein